jgi:hypothetical protein
MRCAANGIAAARVPTAVAATVALAWGVPGMQLEAVVVEGGQGGQGARNGPDQQLLP